MYLGRGKSSLQKVAARFAHQELEDAMIHFRKIKVMEWQQVIVDIVKLLEPEIYVEIGVQKGYTFNAVAPLVKKAYAIDPVIERSVDSGENIVQMEMTSDKAAENWKEPIDILFIDGDHSEEQTRKDFYSFWPFVVPGTGLIFFHDTHPVFERLVDNPSYCGGCWRVAKKLRQLSLESGIEIMTMPGPHAGLSIVRKLKNGNHFSWRED